MSTRSRTYKTGADDAAKDSSMSGVDFIDNRLPLIAQPTSLTEYSQHDRNRARSCACCLQPLRRADFVQAKKYRRNCDLTAADNPLLAKVVHFLPGYHTGIPTLGTGICATCISATTNVLRKLPTRVDGFSAAVAKINAAHKVDVVAARSCANDGPTCAFCNEYEVTAANFRAKRIPPAPRDALAPVTRRKRDCRVAPPPVEKKVPKLSSADVLAAKNEGVSARLAARMATVARRRHDSGASDFTSVSGSVVRRDATLQNKCLAHLFEWVPCSLSQVDLSAYVCRSLSHLIVCIAHLRGDALSSLKTIKFTLDGGQGSLKYLMQLLWADDPVLSSASFTERRHALASHRGLSDNGGSARLSVR